MRLSQNKCFPVTNKMTENFIEVKVRNGHEDGMEQDVPFLTRSRNNSHTLSINRLRACSEPSKRGCLWFPQQLWYYFALDQKIPVPHSLPVTTKNFSLLTDQNLESSSLAKTMSPVPPTFFPWQHTSIAFVRTAEATPEHTLQRLYLPGFMPCNILQHDESMTIVVKREHGFITVPLHSVCVRSSAPGGLLASDVGTGKTAIMLYHAVQTAAAGPTLIIVPTTLEGQWISEAQRVFGQTNVVTDPAKFQEKTVNIWRCNTLVSYHKMRNHPSPEAPWTIVLVTYDFLAARVKELCGPAKRSVNFSSLLQSPAQFSAQHNLVTCFHDIQWNRIICDEIQDGLKRYNKHFWHFVNALPARHVWAMSATPTDFKGLANVLRLTSRAVTEPNGKDVSKLLSNLNVDISYSLVQPRLFRVTKEDTTERMRTGVQCTIVPLTLTDTEKRIMNYLRLLGGMANDALVCTDVQSFLQELLITHKDLSVGATGEAVICNIEAFWDRMRFENVTVGHELEQELNILKQRIRELRLMLDALQDQHEVSQVRAELRKQEGVLKTRQANMAKVAVKQEFLDNLNNRIEEAKVNPCPICVDDIGEGRMAITVCGHVFCIDCVKSWFAKHNNCPACRRSPLNMSDITVVDNRVTTSLPEVVVPAKPQSVYSTKIDFLLTHLRHVLSTTPDRVIVFCNYPATLKKLYGVLVSEGIDVACMTGNVHGKNKNMLKFKGRLVSQTKEGLIGNQDTCRVMLLHTVTQNSGMDLIEANRIVFVDVHKLDPNVLRQAYGRCDRLGQTKDIHLTFLTVPEFEEIPPLQQYVSGLQARV